MVQKRVISKLLIIIEAYVAKDIVKFWERMVKMRARRGMSIFVNIYIFMLGELTK